MIHRSVFFSTVILLEIVYSLAQDEKIEAVELFHICIDPQRDENEPVKSPVVLLHGVFGSLKSYEGIDRLIADRTKRRVCSVDLRNHGDSPWNNRSDIATMTKDIGHFLDTQNINKVNFIGESLGGKIALHYTLNNPNRVDSIVVEDMHPQCLGRLVYYSLKIFVRLIYSILESQPKDMNEDQANKWAKERIENDLEKVTAYQNVPEDILKFFELRKINGKWQTKFNIGFLYEHSNKLNELWLESTGLYTGPSLFIYGTQSVFKVGAEKDHILKKFPNARLFPLEGSGHFIHELNREFDDIVVKFLNEID